ncbi:hypothetical protein ccbrp13_43230 [Ktedonobacteria bacterium brp13]|nr:hypothetical protein ccbrp13_43230 [Ktedonobacteria bacterium brp13]
MKRYLLVISIFVALMALFCTSCSGSGSTLTGGPNSKSTSASTPTPTPTPLIMPQGAVKSIPVVASYYQAIKEKNYTLAYTFVDANAKNSSGQTLTEASFKQMALASDSESGAIVNVEIDPASTDSTQILLTIDRSSSLHYHAHLTLKQEGTTWKIISLDRI